MALNTMGCLANSFDVQNCTANEPAVTMRSVDSFDAPLEGMEMTPEEALDTLAEPKPAVAIVEPEMGERTTVTGALALVGTADVGTLEEYGPGCEDADAFLIPGELRFTPDGEADAGVKVGLRLRVSPATEEETLYWFDPPQVEISQELLAYLAPDAMVADVDSFTLNYALMPEPFIVGGLGIGDKGQVCFQTTNVGVPTSCDEVVGGPPGQGGDG
ncbi:MAG: hypothetical protein D6705_14410 [Deltaproteobacteria bacterium]|nr:MAG: hypothetical protein D6705_14410 [Deltaproteobacteria bacterium]